MTSMKTKSIILSEIIKVQKNKLYLTCMLKHESTKIQSKIGNTKGWAAVRLGKCESEDTVF